MRHHAGGSYSRHPSKSKGVTCWTLTARRAVGLDLEAGAKEGVAVCNRSEVVRWSARQIVNFLNEKQVATMMGLSVKTLQRWRLFGYGPEWKKFGTAVRYPADALQAWIASAPHGGESQVRESK